MKKGKIERLRGVFQQENKTENTEEIIQKVFLYFVGSFRFSQGDSYLQQLLHLWVVKNNLISRKEIKIFTSLPTEEIAKKLAIPKTHILRSKQKEVNKQIKILKKSRKRWLTSSLIIEKEILIRMLQRDEYYLKTGRPSQVEKPARLLKVTDSIHDQFASHVRKYVLQNINVHNPIFTELFQRLHAICLTLQSETGVNLNHQNQQLLGLLYRIEKKWENKHPGHSFYVSSKN